MKWLEKVNGDPLSWLLEPDKSGVRFLALRELLDMPPDHPDCVEARKNAYTSSPICRILDAMQPEGFWVRPGAGYNPKYRSSVWSIILLAQLGASVMHDERIAKACQYMLEHGLTLQGQFSASGTPGGTADCLQGNLCDAMFELGVKDARLEKAINWMARSVTGEGIAPNTDRSAELRYYAGNCGPLFACGSNLTEPCAWGAVKIMLAFSKLPKPYWTPLVARAVEEGVRFLFSVDPATAAYPHPMAKKASGNWWKFGFPVFYVTDLLQLLESLARLGYGHDPRLRSAFDLVLEKQDQDGRWALEYEYSGKTWVDFGEKKQANKWVTLRALRVIKLSKSPMH